MHSYFISDLHLSEERPDIVGAFLEFLSKDAPGADALYILGDLFEYWIGDDDTSALTRDVADKLKALSEQGVDCYYIHGNRDFMLGKRYAKACGMVLLEEEHLLNLYGKKVLILHGDTLCTDDVQYQEYRRKTQSPWLRRLFLLMPLFVREKIAERIRSNSKRSKKGKTFEIMDVNADEVEQRFFRMKLDYMIHGHTHRPAFHPRDNGKHGQRIVLGDWYSQSSVLKVTPETIVLTANGEQLELDQAQ
ncbi:UDP-2,3-diacylglucosamine diphosphatase [Aliagarivorans taiwanensis]|uniref:UDP-2,3-diacylglucosamine diphosphatase n=1 Tax=Aliagarivorans taiwanensis TaxID=561966 RepID=UPI00040BB01F|nr:UDP-2,3-diacylglucosamine diphosphatase [Aliagarivorans taiwanensis]